MDKLSKPSAAHLCRRSTAELDFSRHVFPPATNDVVEDEDDIVEADDTDADFVFVTDNSDSTSIASFMYAGYVENGRRYQIKRKGEYWGPSDEKQFQSMQAAHLLCVILDSKRDNPPFRSPVRIRCRTSLI